MRYSYPNVAMLSLRVLVLVTGTTYLCESGFSIRLQIKTKARNRLEVQDDMRLALTQTKSRISKLVTQMQPRSSHKLLILLRHICSVTFTFLSNIFFKINFVRRLISFINEKNRGSPTFLINLKRVSTKMVGNHCKCRLTSDCVVNSDYYNLIGCGGEKQNTFELMNPVPLR